jgi:DNA-binding MarR family transcriptional regulator
MSTQTASKSDQGPGEGPPYSALAGDLRAVIRRTARRMRIEAPVEEVTPSQYSVLSALKHGACTVSALAEREHVSSPAITRSVLALEARGLVERVPDPGDRRHVVVSLSPQGREIVDASLLRRTEWLEQRLAGLSTTDLETLAAAVRILTLISNQ